MFKIITDTAHQNSCLVLQLFQSKNISSFLSDVLQNPSQSPETLLLKFSETLWPLFCFNGDADVLLPSKEASCLCFIILLNSPFHYSCNKDFACASFWGSCASFWGSCASSRAG